MASSSIDILRIADSIPDGVAAATEIADILRIADLATDGVAVVLTLVDILHIADSTIGSPTPHVPDAAG